MKGFSTRKAIGLLLALFLAASPGFCWDCCCSTPTAPTEPATQAKGEHDCCVKPNSAAVGQTVTSSAGCECLEFVSDRFESPSVLSAVWTVDSKDSGGTALAVLVDSPSASHRLTAGAHDATEAPPRLPLHSVSSAAPRAPPTAS